MGCCSLFRGLLHLWARAALAGVDIPQTISFVSGDQHYEVLEDVLIEANENVSILSGWIGSPLLDPRIQEAFSEALKRGVNIRIGFGWESSAGHDLSPIGKQDS